MGICSEKLPSESFWLKIPRLWLPVLESRLDCFINGAKLDQQWVLDPTVVNPQTAQHFRRPGARALPKRDDVCQSIRLVPSRICTGIMETAGQKRLWPIQKEVEMFTWDKLREGSGGYRH